MWQAYKNIALGSHCMEKNLTLKPLEPSILGCAACSYNVSGGLGVNFILCKYTVVVNSNAHYTNIYRKYLNSAVKKGHHHSFYIKSLHHATLILSYHNLIVHDDT